MPSGRDCVEPSAVRRRLTRLIVVVGLLLSRADPLVGSPLLVEGRSMAAEYRARADELEAYLRRHVLGVRFPGAVDRERGGFHIRFTREWTRMPDPDRFIVYEARLTWTAAKAALALPDLRDDYRHHVRHGVTYLKEAYWDRDQGGFRSFVQPEGGEHPQNGIKLAYANAFAVYALAAAFEVTKEPETLALAQQAFRWMERRFREEGRPGYLGAVRRDGSPIPFDPDAVRPTLETLNAPAAYRAMNPHIHLLEAYAELLRVWPDPVLRARAVELHELVRDRFFTEPGCLHLYLLPDGRPVPGSISFGHDIETAFLLVEAAEALGKPEDPRTLRASRMLVDHTLAFGWNAETGQLYDRGWAFEPAFDRSVQWWALYEAMNAMLLMHERHGATTPAYWDAFEKTWRFTRATLTDGEHGGIYLGLDEHGTLRTEKSGNWFASYHQARALLLSIERLRRLAGG